MTVRVSNFRALANVEVHLDDLTVLLGANNSGKTSFLDALCIAVGLGQSRMTLDDIHIGRDELAPPSDRQTIIDVLIKPTSETNETQETFPEAGFWIDLFGNGVVQDESNDDDDIVAIRTKLTLESGELVRTRCYLSEWLPFETWLEANEKDSRVSSKTLEPLAIQYIDAKRDLDDELNRQTSFWGRLTSDLGFDEAALPLLTKGLGKLNSQICEKSSVLNAVGLDLNDLDSVINPGNTNVEITAVPVQLRDLTKKLSINISSDGGQSFPLGKHGVGTRSFSSLLVFRAFAKWKQKLALTKNAQYHPLLALEEPEAHLHPQAQRTLHSQMKIIPGQRIVSTHSPYFASQVDLSSIRLFQQGPEGVKVTSLDTNQLGEEDKRKLEREIFATRGDLLFAKAIILCEGETEEQSLPVFAECYFRRSVHEFGFCFVSVKSNSNYTPFVRLASELGIPWFIFSDGEELTIKNVKSNLDKLSLSWPDVEHRVKFLPNNNDFEGYLLATGYQSEIETAMTKTKDPGEIEGFKLAYDGQSAGKNKVHCFSGEGGHLEAIRYALKKHKTKLAPLVAREIVANTEIARQLPPLVKELFTQIKEDLKIACH